MIVVRLKNGTVWNVLAFDAVTVATFDGASTAFQVGDIAEILIDVIGGQLSLLDGSNERSEVRALQVIDGETGVPVRLVFPLELARGVGEKMAEGKIIVARTLPPQT